MNTRKKPDWIRVRVPAGGQSATVDAAIASGLLHTVCDEAECPNRPECYADGTATFLILGNVCTRACSFCAVDHGLPVPPDPGEPGRVAVAARSLGLRHVVITSVTRDDLSDGGASHFAATIREVRKVIGAGTVEVLVPDFGGRVADILTVIEAGPDVFNHNIEVVRRLQAAVRPQADYDRSLCVLSTAARLSAKVVTKSGLMVGFGETENEVVATLGDLRTAGCDLLTIGQYLAPSDAHVKVAEYVRPETFERYRKLALDMGFVAVTAGPLVRSSYRSAGLFNEVAMRVGGSDR